MIGAIAELRLDELAARLKERDISIEVLPEAKAFIASEGYDRRFGARPLKRAIQSLLENPLSRSILSGELTEGDRVKVGKEREGLSFLVQHDQQR